MEAVLKKSLYRGMLYIRTVEERIAELYPDQEMRCPVHLCIGQEAAEAGSAMALEISDQAISGHRSHGHYLAKGGDLKSMMAEIYGKAAGCAGGKGGSMHLIDLSAGFLGSAPIVGSTIPIGVGAALTAKMKDTKQVVMIFLGDGATETGVFHESVDFAVLKNLPAVFVCENNLYSVYSPMNVRQPEGRSIADLARAHGMTTRAGDGNDVEEVYRFSRAAVETARSGKGPVFLEFATYRWLEHCGPNLDNHIGYRSEAEFEKWRAQDPLARYREKLISDGVATPGELDAMAEELSALMEDAVAFAKSSPFPKPEQAAQNVYAD